MKETLPEEPPVSDDVAAVRFQLPQGIKLARRFHKSHTVKVINFIFYSLFFIYFVRNIVGFDLLQMRMENVIYLLIDVT
jgi:hypothetical protein